MPLREPGEDRREPLGQPLHGFGTHDRGGSASEHQACADGPFGQAERGGQLRGDFFRARCVGLFAELFDQISGVDSHRAVQRAESVGRAGLFAGKFVIDIELFGQLGAALGDEPLSSPPQNDPLAR